MATTNLKLELPQANHTLAEDVIHIADNFQKIDQAYFDAAQALATTREAIEEKTNLFSTTINEKIVQVSTKLEELRADYTETIKEVRTELKSETANLRTTFKEALDIMEEQFADLELFQSLPYALGSMSAAELDAYLAVEKQNQNFVAMLADQDKRTAVINTSIYMETIATSYSAWQLFKANDDAVEALLANHTSFLWVAVANDFAANSANTDEKTCAFCDFTETQRATIAASTELTAKINGNQTAMTRIAGDLDWLYTLCVTTSNVTARANLEIGLNNYQLNEACYATLTTEAGKARFNETTRAWSSGSPSVGSATSPYLAFLYNVQCSSGNFTLYSFAQGKAIRQFNKTAARYFLPTAVAVTDPPYGGTAAASNAWGKGTVQLGGIYSSAAVLGSHHIFFTWFSVK